MSMFKVHMKFRILDAQDAFMRNVENIHEGIELVTMDYVPKGEVILPYDETDDKTDDNTDDK